MPTWPMQQMCNRQWQWRFVGGVACSPEAYKEDRAQFLDHFAIALFYF
jgi:hypothetical protein